MLNNLYNFSHWMAQGGSIKTIPTQYHRLLSIFLSQDFQQLTVPLPIKSLIEGAFYSIQDGSFWQFLHTYIHQYNQWQYKKKQLLWHWYYGGILLIIIMMMVVFMGSYAITFYLMMVDGLLIIATQWFLTKKIHHWNGQIQLMFLFLKLINYQPIDDFIGHPQYFSITTLCKTHSMGSVIGQYIPLGPHPDKGQVTQTIYHNINFIYNQYKNFLDGAIFKTEQLGLAVIIGNGLVLLINMMIMIKNKV